jgi:hypothetical protein
MVEFSSKCFDYSLQSASWEMSSRKNGTGSAVDMTDTPIFLKFTTTNPPSFRIPASTILNSEEPCGRVRNLLKFLMVEFSSKCFDYSLQPASWEMSSRKNGTGSAVDMTDTPIFLKFVIRQPAVISNPCQNNVEFIRTLWQGEKSQ